VACGVIGAIIVLGALFPSGALAAFEEFYGGGSICGSNCYVQSAGAHTFNYNEGFSQSGTPALACQLFNSGGTNEVTHGGGFCSEGYFGGQYVWARVYNQSGSSHVVTGYAQT
jgi:hypothetical protein